MNITALLDKFAAITEEQAKEFAAAVEAKDMAAVEAFCQKRGIDLAADERDAAAEFFKTGKMPLADDELENVAGGCGFESNGDTCPKCHSKNVDVDVYNSQMLADVFGSLFTDGICIITGKKRFTCRGCKHSWYA
jgi:hypothetical protein